MQPIIHSFQSKEPMLRVNAFIIETEAGSIAVDTTLTVSDSLAFKKTIDQLDKPLLGILLTHGHPDHVAGTTHLAPHGEVPIYALQSVYDLMKETEASKHQQWSGMFGDEWISRWVYPTHIVKDGDTIELGGLSLQVCDLGAGGDCDANALWLVKNTPHAFLGDFIYSQNHTYAADGSILRWIANLERWSPVLKDYEFFYVGHGSVCHHAAIHQQKEYLTTYCAHVLQMTNGGKPFTDETKAAFEQTMFARYPDYGCQFMVKLAADKVWQELTGNVVHSLTQQGATR